MSEKDTEPTYAPVTYYGLDQMTHVPAEAWAEFFAACREWAAVVRERRASASLAAHPGDGAPPGSAGNTRGNGTLDRHKAKDAARPASWSESRQDSPVPFQK